MIDRRDLVGLVRQNAMGSDEGLLFIDADEGVSSARPLRP
jgi:hypothetical protein